MQIKRIVLFLIVVCVTWVSPANAASPVCVQSDSTNPASVQIQKEIESRIAYFSNRPLFAREADTVLTQLITSKSPVVTSWMKRRNLYQQPEEQIAREWRKYYFENFLLAKYPFTHPEANRLMESFFNEVHQKVFTKEAIQKFTLAFRAAKTLVLGRLEGFEIPSTEKKQIVSRVTAVQIFLFPKDWYKSSKVNRLEFLRWGVAYDPVPNRVNVGAEALSYRKNETLVSAFAHEIAHAFDPCRWGAFFKGKNPFEEVIKCLRRADSAGAKVRDDQWMESLVQAKKLDPQLAMSLKMNPTCNKMFYPPEGVQKDQISEVFADWFSAESMALNPETTMTFREDLCKKRELKPGSAYPSNLERLERIYFAHPVFKKRFGVKSSVRYCGFGQSQK